MAEADVAAVRREADALVVSLRAKGVNQALADALLTIFERGSRGGFHPSELLHDTLELLCKRRTPPPLSSIKLPLRTKAEFIAALEHSSLDTALRSGVVALDKMRRAGTLDACSQTEAIGAEAELLACSVNPSTLTPRAELFRDKTLAWEASRKAEVAAHAPPKKKRQPRPVKAEAEKPASPHSVETVQEASEGEELEVATATSPRAAGGSRCSLTLMVDGDGKACTVHLVALAE